MRPRLGLLLLLLFFNAALHLLLFAMCSSAKTCSTTTLIVIIINGVLLTIGFTSLAMGIWLLVAEGSYLQRYEDIMAESGVKQDFFRAGAIVMTSGGAAIFMLSALGIVAACTYNTCLLALYSVALSALLALEVVAVVLAVIFREEWKSKIDEGFLSAFSNTYHQPYSLSSETFSSAFDRLQEELQCCGWNNGTDYVQPGVAPLFWREHTEDGRKVQVPELCCLTENITLRFQCVTDPTASIVFNTKGCRLALTSVVTTYETVTIGLCSTIMFLELLMVAVAAMILTCTVHNKYNIT